MELTIVEQILEVIGKAHRVAVVITEPKNPDVVAGSLALRQFFQKQEKEAVLVTTEVIDENLRFLTGAESFKIGFNSGKDFTISVNTQLKPLDEISYQAEDGKIQIYLKPKTGQFTPQDVSFSTAKQPFDAVVLLGVASMEVLGSLLEMDSDPLFEAPKINIDINPANEYYGAINFVDINATSVCELLALLFEKFEQQAVDEDMATALLTGIISKTHSFQHSQTTPRAFLKASELIALGGRQQEVIKNLFKTKPLPLLRLWGRAMARLKIHDSLPIMYSLLNLSDFGKAGASNKDLQLVLKELLDSVSGYKAIGLLSESMGGHVCVLMALHQQVNLSELEKTIGNLSKLSSLSGPYNIMQAELKNTNLADAEQLFVQGLSNSILHAE